MGLNKSPYLFDRARLADVIAAIQTLGTYKFYKLDFKSWADRISGDPASADHWRKVFEQHPEFFRLDAKRERASLVWRRQRQKLFNVDMSKEITRREYLKLNEEQKKRVSRIPLQPAEIETLINCAVNLHARALESEKDSRWLVTSLIGLLGVLLGATITSFH